MTDTAAPAPTADQLATLIDKVGGYDQALRIVSGAVAIRLMPVGPIPAGQTITVPADADFETRVAHGRYGWRHEALTGDLFPVTEDQIGEHELRLFHFARNISSEDIVRLIRDEGFEPARIGDVLAFGAAFPEVQRLHPVVGLGSTAEIDGKSSAPALWFDGDSRTIDLIWLDGDWHRNYRFLAVRAPLPAEVA